jgi:probable rRNA maturation factor
MSLALYAMTLAIYDHQTSGELDVDWLESVARRALPLCSGNPGKGAALLLGDLEEIEVSLLDDAAIAEVNERFLSHTGPTDVITFDHGEILIGVGVARENAAAFGKTLKEEVALYIVHGLLHLNGWEDKCRDEAAEMATLQETILAKAIGKLRP